MKSIKLMAAAFVLPVMMTGFWQDGACQHNKKTRGPDKKMDSVQVGMWGGESINVEVTESGANINYACAHGTIDQQIVPDKNGRFEVTGTHARERPGPVREGQENAGQPALYTGSTNGQTMTFTVALSATKEVVGTFTITHGKRTRIVKCQ